VHNLLADLHIHTCLSPCGELEMLPELIVQRARQLDIRVIGVTDHNSAENAAAVVNAARGTGIHVLPGMEVQTREEVHIITLFDTIEQVMVWQDQVYLHLPPLKNNVELFGQQIVLDDQGEPRGCLDRILITSTSLSIEEVVQTVSRLGGISIPAHVERPTFSLIVNLGFIPPDLDILGVEISRRIDPHQARRDFPELQSYSLISSSDAHRLSDMVARMTITVDSPTISELSMALAGICGRCVRIEGLCTNPYLEREPDALEFVEAGQGEVECTS